MIHPVPRPSRRLYALYFIRVYKLYIGGGIEYPGTIPAQVYSDGRGASLRSKRRIESPIAYLGKLPAR